MWCVPRLDAEYINRMEDLLDLYERKTSANEPVVCFDEKPVQLLGQVHPLRPIRRSGQVVLEDYEYVRRGTAVVFVAVEPKAGWRLAEVRERRTALDFATLIAKIAAAYPRARRIHLVMDNLNTHRLKSLILRFGAKRAKKIWRRFKIHYTPCHASWLNQAEIELNVLGHECLGSRRFGDLNRLRQEVSAWRQRRNRSRATIQWSFTKRRARKRFGY